MRNGCFKSLFWGVVSYVEIDNWYSSLTNTNENDSSIARMGRAGMGVRDAKKMITSHERSEVTIYLLLLDRRK